jgi:hypothetical protein
MGIWDWLLVIVGAAGLLLTVLRAMRDWLEEPNH